MLNCCVSAMRARESSELSEILQLSDRILVMYEGEIAGELQADEATEEQISLLMAGGKERV